MDAATPDIDVDRLEGGKVCGDIEDHPRLELRSAKQARVVPLRSGCVAQSLSSTDKTHGAVDRRLAKGHSRSSEGCSHHIERSRAPIQHAPAADECHFLKHIVKTVFGYQVDTLTFRDATPGNTEAGKISVWSYKM